MKKIVLVTGSGGFVGNAVLRCAAADAACSVEPLRRKNAALQVRDVREQNPTAQISIINLAWPSLSRYSASLGQVSQDNDEWSAFRRWMTSLAETAAEEKVRFFHIGSGIEPYALCAQPSVGEPYLSYARRKEEIWKLVHSHLFNTSWRLRLHFLFGPGEASHRFVPAAFRAAKTGAPLTIGAPERMRCWLHVDDVGRGLLAAAMMDDPENWDICGANAVSFNDLLSLIHEAADSPINTVRPSEPIADAACLSVQPRAVAPTMPHGAGAMDDLRKRLKEYARTLLS